MENTYAIIGAACDLGVTYNGSALGPALLLKDYRNKLLIEQNPTYQKSTDPRDLSKNFKELTAYLSNLYQTINQVTALDCRVLLVGGDHSCAIANALASALKYQSIGLLWLDAHSDYHTLKTTQSGNLHGLPCAVINGLEKEMAPFHQGSYLEPQKTVIFGARSIDEGEKQNIERSGVRVITMQEIRCLGLKRALSKVLPLINHGNAGFHVSYDLDVLDPTLAPGVSTPVNGGFTLKEYQMINAFLQENASAIVSFDLMEYNPLNDQDKKTFTLAEGILDTLLQTKVSTI